MTLEKLKIPILPVQNLVFFPHTTVPLSIENPMAIQIIKDCIEFECPVGLGFMENFSLPFNLPRNICGIGIPIMLEDNISQIKVLISGVNRVRVGKIIQNFPYSLYEVEIFSDVDETIDPLDVKVAKLKNLFDRWLEQSLLRPHEKHQLMVTLAEPANLVDYISMFLLRDLETRQVLLESPSLSERIHTLSLIFREGNPFAEDPYVVLMMKEFDQLEKSAHLPH